MYVHLLSFCFFPCLITRSGNRSFTHTSSTLGSIGITSHFSPFTVLAYKISKAALNMLTVQYVLAYADQGFTFITVSPGVSLSGPLAFHLYSVYGPFRRSGVEREALQRSHRRLGESGGTESVRGRKSAMVKWMKEGDDG